MLAAVLCALLTEASAEAAPVTVGSPLTATFNAHIIDPPGTVINSGLPEAGAHVSSPVKGTIVRWRITGAAGTPFKLRVLTPVGGSTFTGAGTSAPQTPSSTSTQTYSTSMPIQAGQTIGIDGTIANIGFANVTGASITEWSPQLADGTTRAGSGASDVEAGFNADVQPLPSISSINPSFGPSSGGTTVTISGQNFEGATAVSFGDTPAASFTVLSDTVMTAVSPPRAAGTVDITVKNPGQNPVMAGDRFTYVASAQCIVPKLKGKKLKAVKKALKNANCQLGKVKRHHHKKGKVKRQNPKAGTVLAGGSKVGVTLGK